MRWSPRAPRVICESADSKLCAGPHRALRCAPHRSPCDSLRAPRSSASALRPLPTTGPPPPPLQCAGNYAPDVLPSIKAKELGYPVCLYLDSSTQSHIEEFSTSNFIGVTQDGTVRIGNLSSMHFL